MMTSDQRRRYLRHRKLEAFALVKLGGLFGKPFRLASDSEDKYGFDSVSVDDSIRAGCRSRSFRDVGRNDFTIRTGYDSNAKTEWEKILEGRQHVMVYAFESNYTKHIVLDFRVDAEVLNKLRKGAKSYENGDGSYFIAIDATAACDAGIVVGIGGDWGAAGW